MFTEFSSIIYLGTISSQGTTASTSVAENEESSDPGELVKALSVIGAMREKNKQAEKEKTTDLEAKLRGNDGTNIGKNIMDLAKKLVKSSEGTTNEGETAGKIEAKTDEEKDPPDFKLGGKS